MVRPLGAWSITVVPIFWYVEMNGRKRAFTLQSAEAEAEARLCMIATAYETLKDEQTKADYDYYLDHF